MYGIMTSEPLLVQCVPGALPVCRVRVNGGHSFCNINKLSIPCSLTIFYLCFEFKILLCKIHRIHCSINTHKISKKNKLIMLPTLKKWETYWFQLVRVCVCVWGGGFEISSLKLHVWNPHGK